MTNKKKWKMGPIKCGRFTDPASLTDKPHTTQHPKIVKKNKKKEKTEKKVLRV